MINRPYGSRRKHTDEQRPKLKHGNKQTFFCIVFALVLFFIVYKLSDMKKAESASASVSMSAGLLTSKMSFALHSADNF